MKRKFVLIFPNLALYVKPIPRLFYAFIPPSHHPPLGLGYLASILEQAGIDVHVIDATVENLSLRKLQNIISEIDPTYIGITSNIAFANAALLTAIACKACSPRSTIILGGPWATTNWDYIIKKNYADFVVVGEGERTIIDLLAALENKDNLRIVKGIAFKADGEVISTGPRPFIQDLDSIPFPAWHMFPSPERYNFFKKKKIALPIMISRGCPYDCNYCTKYVHGYKIRYRSVENVIDEIKYLKNKFNVEELLIVDDNFTFDLQKAKKILERIIQENLHLNITLSNGIRADKINHEILSLLKKAGTLEIAIGVESGCQDVVDKIGKNLKLSDVKRSASMIKRMGFLLKGYFMIGHPYDTPETMMQTINFAIQIDPDTAHFAKTTPWRGTKLYDLIKKHGTFVIPTNRVESYNLLTTRFKIWQVTPELVQQYFKLAYLKFYLRFSKILSFLRKIHSITQIKWLFTVIMMVIIEIFGS